MPQAGSIPPNERHTRYCVAGLAAFRPGVKPGLVVYLARVTLLDDVLEVVWGDAHRCNACEASFVFTRVSLSAHQRWRFNHTQTETKSSDVPRLSPSHTGRTSR